MRIRVISLPRSSDRRAHIDRQIGRHGLDRSFFDAIDGDRGRQAFDRCDERQFRINVARPVTAGEIGCFASHRLLWRECADSDQPLLIMEDDATLERHFPAALEFARRHIHRYGFLRFQTEWPSKRARMTKITRRPEFDIVRYTRYPLGTMAYALTPGVARSLLQASRTMTLPVDAFIKRFWIHRQPLYGFFPGPVTGCRQLALTIEGRVRGDARWPERSRRKLRMLGDALARTRFNIECARASFDRDNRRPLRHNVSRRSG